MFYYLQKSEGVMKEKFETTNDCVPHSYLCNIRDCLANKTPNPWPLSFLLMLMYNTMENQISIVNQPLLGDAFKCTPIWREEISARELCTSFMQEYQLYITSFSLVQKTDRIKFYQEIQWLLWRESFWTQQLGFQVASLKGQSLCGNRLPNQSTSDTPETASRVSCPPEVLPEAPGK